jgi:hypothetical protein
MRIVLKDYANFDFFLIGICSQEYDYKLCSQLNKLLELDFCRIDDIDIQSKKSNLNQFPMFRYIATDSDSNTKQDEVIISETDTVYYLFGNRNGSVNLIPEQKQTDYFLKIQTEAEFIDVPELVRKIKELPSVLAAFSINPEQLKSKENLIF